MYIIKMATSAPSAIALVIELAHSNISGNHRDSSGIGQAEAFARRELSFLQSRQNAR